MKIEKVNENKIKISFDYSELEENNISVHSFLSNSYSTQKLFLAILDIANEEFGFNAKNCKISYETISFDNKEFLVIITKSTNSLESNNLSPYNLLEICNKNNFNKSYSNNIKNDNYLTSEKDSEIDSYNLSCPIYNIKNDTQILLYEFDTMEELYSFCDYLKNSLSQEDFKNSLYQYDNKFFLEINFENLKLNDIKKITSIISEYKNFLIISRLTIFKLKECANLIIEDNAIQLLEN